LTEISRRFNDGLPLRMTINQRLHGYGFAYKELRTSTEYRTIKQFRLGLKKLG
jgi:hypothetical protein